MSNKVKSTSNTTVRSVGETDGNQLPDEGNMTLLEHLTEFRTRMLKAIGLWVIIVVCCLFFSADILNFLLEPYNTILQNNEEIRQSGVEPRVIATALYEIFLTKIMAAAFLGTVLTSPVLLYQIWKFIAPGLYKNERSAFWPFLVASPILFLMGAAMVYYVLIPVAWTFFLHTQQLDVQGSIDIVIEAKISQYFGLVMRLILAFGFCFQLPVAATLLGRVGIINSTGMANARKYAILVSLCVAAILTPPDPASLIALGLPIIILYEISILLVKMIERGREDDEFYDDEDDEEDDEGFEES